MLSTVRSTVAEELAFGLENRGTARPDMLRAVARTAEQTGPGRAPGPGPRHPFRRGTAPAGHRLRRHPAPACWCWTNRSPPWTQPASSRSGTSSPAHRRRHRRRGAEPGRRRPGPLRRALARPRRRHRHRRGPPRRADPVSGTGRTGTVIHASPIRRSPALRPAVRDAAPDAGAARAGAGAGRLGFSFPRAGGPAGEPLLRDLGLTVRPGRDRGRHRANGAGKSTLLRHLNGLLRPHTGDVRVHGTEHRRHPGGPCRDFGGAALPASPGPAV